MNTRIKIKRDILSDVACHAVQLQGLVRLIEDMFELNHPLPFSHSLLVFFHEVSFLYFYVMAAVDAL
jgi:hypothetical protein